MNSFSKKPLLILSIICLGFSSMYSQPFNSNSNGRIAISSDGNKHDNDDWAGTAMSLMILAKANLQDKLVLYTYSDHIWGNDSQNDVRQMRESINGSKQRWGFNNTTFIEAVSNPNGAYNAMRDAINASTAQNRLYIIAGGPMQVIGEGLNRANNSARNHVTVIQHSKFNQFHSDGTQGQNRPEENHNGWNWDELVNRFSNVEFVKIKDQNGNNKRDKGFNTQDISGNIWAPWNWMKDSSDESIRWVYNRALNGVRRPDWSDAGMAWYLIKNDVNGGPNKLRSFIGNGINSSSNRQTNSKNNDTKTSKENTTDSITENAIEIDAYPNPLNDRNLTIELSKNTENAEISLYDINGKRIFNSFTNETVYKINNRIFPSKGIYVLTVKEASAPMKIIKIAK